MSYLLRIRSRGIEVKAKTLDEISSAYAHLRDESGEGAATWPSGSVFELGAFGRSTPVGYTSFNARIFSPNGDLIFPLA